jgi:hypothetical protein
MHLSAKQFAEILGRLESDVRDAPFPGHDQRRAARVALKNRATIVPYEDGVAGEGVGVEVRDFSPRGIRFLHSERLGRGSQFVLALPQSSGEPVQILCTVMHCRATAEGPISTGAEFTCVLRPHARAAEGGGRDRRSERDRIRQSILD